MSLRVPRSVKSHAQLASQGVSNITILVIFRFGFNIFLLVFFFLYITISTHHSLTRPLTVSCTLDLYRLLLILCSR